MNSSDANNTLIDEMMQLLIAEKEKAFPTILAKLYNQAMIVERETHLGAGSYERGGQRRHHGSGDLHRDGHQRRWASEHHRSRLRVQ